MYELQQPRLIFVPSTVPMQYLSVLALITVMAITPAPTGQHLVAATTAEVIRPGAVEIAVDVNGSFYINNRPVAEADFSTTLLQALRASPSDPSVIHLFADRDAPFSRVEQAIALAGVLGVRRAELVARCPRARETYLRRCASEPLAAPNAHR